MKKFSDDSVSVIQRTWPEFWKMLSDFPKTGTWDGKPYVVKPLLETSYVGDHLFFDDQGVQLREEGCYLETMGIAKIVRVEGMSHPKG